MAGFDVATLTWEEGTQNIFRSKEKITVRKEVLLARNK
jgi:hypothetical protein